MRKAKPKKRLVLPDPVYGDQKVSKFVNHLMYDGKKNISYEIFYKALEIVGEKMKDQEKPALEIWKAALDKITPQVEVKSRRIGGATFQVPTEIRPDRKESVSMKNMIGYARKRAEAVSKILTTKYGIKKNRITVDSKGDTVQPYEENDKNRVTICIAE